MYLRLVSRRDLEGDLDEGFEWLEEVESALRCLGPLKLNPQSVEEEMKKLHVYDLNILNCVLVMKIFM